MLKQNPISKTNKLTSKKNIACVVINNLGVYRYKGDSMENFILIARASAHLLLHSRNNSTHKVDARTQNEVHI